MNKLRAEVAPDARAAAQVYPAAWWLSMLTLPGDNEFQKSFTMEFGANWKRAGS